MYILYFSKLWVTFLQYQIKKIC